MMYFLSSYSNKAFKRNSKFCKGDEFHTILLPLKHALHHFAVFPVHYEIAPMQYTEIFSAVKIENFTRKKNDTCIFNIFAQYIHCRYTLEAVLTSTHNVCFGSKIRKLGIPLQTPLINVGIKVVFIARTCFPDVF